MNRGVTSKQMKEIEDCGQRLGISRLMMMENAGSSVAAFIHQLSLRNRVRKRKMRVVAIAGTGNNGGDVFVAARHLLYWSKENIRISLVLIGSDRVIRSEEALANWKVVSKLRSLRKFIIDKPQKLGILKKEMADSDLLIIGIFGTGFKGVPRELQLKAIREINSAQRPLKVSVDIPSGMECDSGVSTYAVDSDVTVTMHAPKIGMIGNNSAGNIVKANIGLPF